MYAHKAPNFAIVLGLYCFDIEKYSKRIESNGIKMMMLQE